MSYYLVLCVIVLIPQLCQSAPCSVICQWVSWNPWNDCSATCGGGTRSRTRPLCCSASTPDFDTCRIGCGHGKYDAYQSQSCNTWCHNGGVYSGFCRCAAANYGSCCQFRITCGKPASLPNGRYSGSDFSYGAVIQYSCNAKYSLINGDEKHTCRKQNSYSTTGYWDGHVPHCAFVASCESNPCLNGGTCINGHDTFRCACDVGWTGTNCELDIQPPVYRDCPNNITYHSADPERFIKWTEPEFWDPHGHDVYVSSNYPSNSHNLPWGEHVVQYVGKKPYNGLKTECLFVISVYTHPCPELDVPQNGAFACNRWNARYTEICALFCEAGHDVPIGTNIDNLYVCGSSGSWIPFNTNVSCTEESNTSADALHYYQKPCTDDGTVGNADVQHKYITRLINSDFSDLCHGEAWADDCKTDNVRLIC